MKWYKIEFMYDDEIEADNEEHAREIIMKRLRNEELDIVIDITEIRDSLSGS